MGALKTIVTLVFISLLYPAGGVRAHSLDPGFLMLEHQNGQMWRVFWRKPDLYGQPSPINAQLPSSCSPRLGPDPQMEMGSWVSRWTTLCSGSLTNGEITIQGIKSTRTDVLVRYKLETGDYSTHRLTADSPSVYINRSSGKWETLSSYGHLGFKHILEGWDHLLFLLALMLLIKDGWKLTGAITAFTIAHSITLLASVLNWVHLKPQPVEVLIALSIIFLANELVLRRSEKRRLSERFPWLMTFVFGLLHGFGFAGALREIGIPEQDTSIALLAFNIGVELGQLTFVVAILLAIALINRIHTTSVIIRTTIFKVSIYLIGSISTFWFIERLSF